MTDNSSLPLVTLAVPVRNGGEMLRAALDSIVNQTYPNIEIIVSDNASNDGTPALLAEYAARYANFRVIRHDQPSAAIENFMFVLQEARGEFFAWCAHDDTRSKDFVASLLPALSDPLTLLAFGDLYIYDGVNSPQLHVGYDFETMDLPRWKRLRKAALMQCYHIYGVWRVSALRAIKYHYVHWWSDMPVMLSAAANGLFCHVPGVQFSYYEIPKTREWRAQYQDNTVFRSRAHDLYRLFRATFLSVRDTAGLPSAALAILFLFEKYTVELLRRIVRSVGL